MDVSASPPPPPPPVNEAVNSENGDVSFVFVCFPISVADAVGVVPPPSLLPVNIVFLSPAPFLCDGSSTTVTAAATFLCEGRKGNITNDQ